MSKSIVVVVAFHFVIKHNMYLWDEMSERRLWKYNIARNYNNNNNNNNNKHLEVATSCSSSSGIWLLFEFVLFTCLSFREWRAREKRNNAAPSRETGCDEMTHTRKHKYICSDMIRVEMTNACVVFGDVGVVVRTCAMQFILFLLAIFNLFVFNYLLLLF